MSWDTRSHTSYASTLQSSPDDPEVLAQDVVRMDKVHRKLKALLMQRGPNGIPGFTRVFADIDKTWDQRLSVWEFRKFFQGVDVKLNGKDLEALFIYYDADGDGEVDYDEFLLALRSRLDMTQQQLDDILRKVRLRILQRHKGNPGAALEAALRRESPTTLSRAQFVRAMTALSLGVHPSDFNFLFQHLSNGGQSPIPFVEVDKVVDDILAEPTPDQQLDNMHQKLIDAMKDRDRTTSGTVGLLRVLRKVDADRTGLLPQEEFRRAMKAYGCGLVDKEIDQCFDFYCDQATQRVSVPDFIISMRDALGADDPPEIICYLFSKLRNILTYKGAQGIIALRAMFDKYAQGSGILSLWDCVSAVRDVGVGGVMSDVELEVMYNSVAENYNVMQVERFISEVRGEVSEAKLDIINQAWNRLDPAGTGTCHFETLLNAFKPSKMPEVQSGKKSEKDVLNTFCDCFDSPSGIIERATFVQFWCNFSVSLPDNNEFSLLVWNAFDLSKQPRAAREAPPARPGSDRGGYGAATPLAGRRRFDLQRPPASTAPSSPPPASPARPLPAPAQGSSPSSDTASRASGRFAARRVAPQRQRPLVLTDDAPMPPSVAATATAPPPPFAALPATPPRPTEERHPSPVPSPEITPEPGRPSSPAVPGRAAPVSPRVGSAARGTQSWGGGATHVNVFSAGPAADAPLEPVRVTGSKGRHMSEAARKELTKGRPF
eukprot:EG_transcript_4183